MTALLDRSPFLAPVNQFDAAEDGLLALSRLQRESIGNRWAALDYSGFGLSPKQGAATAKLAAASIERNAK